LAFNGVIEKSVVELWQKIAANGCEMLTVGGQALKILYAGRLSDETGGDFKDAVIKLESTVLRGSIELHTHSRDWQAHGHHMDPAYNGVILHVVMWQRPGDTTIQENGHILPTVALARYAEAADTDTFRGNSLPYHRNNRNFTEIIGEAGLERFREKSAAFQTRLKNTEPAECLYQGVMEALGYSRNKEPFLILAKAMPLKMVELVVRQENGPELLESVLLKVARLLPSQRKGQDSAGFHDKHVEQLEGLWSFSGLQAAVPVSSWNFFKVRPGNHPVRRIIGMSNLIAGCSGTGFFNRMTSITGLSSGEIMEIFKIAAGEYWVNRFDFGKTCFGLGNDLIGRARASEIVINAVLPFMYVWHREAAGRVLDLYRGFPAVCENTVEKHMREKLGLKRAEVNTACRQQGLLHIFKRYCITGNCEECRLGGPVPGEKS
jgi:hypothetical protein